jgi:hypothetical protein
MENSGIPQADETRVCKMQILALQGVCACLLVSIAYSSQMDSRLLMDEILELMQTMAIGAGSATNEPEITQVINTVCEMAERLMPR